MDRTARIAVIGAGNVGLAVAYYLVTHHQATNVVIIDPRDPMSLTSAQSGENYRNWWPHPVMTAFTDSPHFSSGTPMTEQSMTAGCV